MKKTISIIFSVLVSLTFPALAEVKVHALKPPLSVSQYKPYEEHALGLEEVSFEFDDVTRKAFLFAPPTASREKPMPLVVLLHGTGRTGASLVQCWKDLAVQQGLLLAGPQAKHAEGWNYSDDSPKFLREVIRKVDSRYALDTTRIYLFGHSAGGYYALDLASHDSAPFAAISLHAGALPRNRFLTRGLAEMATKKPLMMVTGTKDDTVPVEKVRQAAETFADSGFPVELYELEGHNHWYYTLAGYINRRAWNHMSRYSLSEPYPLQ